MENFPLLRQQIDEHFVDITKPGGLAGVASPVVEDKLRHGLKLIKTELLSNLSEIL